MQRRGPLAQRRTGLRPRVDDAAAEVRFAHGSVRIVAFVAIARLPLRPPPLLLAWGVESTVALTRLPLRPPLLLLLPRGVESAAALTRYAVAEQHVLATVFALQLPHLLAPLIAQPFAGGARAVAQLAAVTIFHPALFLTLALLEFPALHVLGPVHFTWDTVLAHRGRRWWTHAVRALDHARAEQAHLP